MTFDSGYLARSLNTLDKICKIDTTDRHWTLLCSLCVILSPLSVLKGKGESDEGDAVTYSTVKASCSSAEPSADLSSLYATINKWNIVLWQLMSLHWSPFLFARAVLYYKHCICSLNPEEHFIFIYVFVFKPHAWTKDKNFCIRLYILVL